MICPSQPAKVTRFQGFVMIDSFTTTAPDETMKEPRFLQLTLDRLDDRQRSLAEQILQVSSSGLGGPYNALLRSPETQSERKSLG
jgi:hypothetical protein